MPPSALTRQHGLSVSRFDSRTSLTRLPSAVRNRSSTRAKPLSLAGLSPRSRLGLGASAGLGQVEVGRVDRGEVLALVGHQRGDGELVDRVGQEQDFQPAAAEDLEVGALGDRGEVGAAQVIDPASGPPASARCTHRTTRVAAGSSLREDANRSSLAIRSLVGRIDHQALLERPAELVVERPELVGIVLGEVVEPVEHALDQRRADLADDAVVLQASRARRSAAGPRNRPGRGGTGGIRAPARGSRSAPAPAWRTGSDRARAGRTPGRSRLVGGQ